MKQKKTDFLQKLLKKFIDSMIINFASYIWRAFILLFINFFLFLFFYPLRFDLKAKIFLIHIFSILKS